MKLILRDDDVSYFTKREELDFVFSDIWGKVEVNLCTIPNVYSRQDQKPAGGNPKDDYYSIDENKQLVKFLKNKIGEESANIWQHGYTHRNYRNLFELERTDLEQLKKELKKGKSILEKAFKVKLDGMVPPHDRLSKQAVLAAEELGFRTIGRAYSPRPGEMQWLNARYMVSATKLFLHYLKYGKRYRYPDALDFGKHKEIFFYRIEELLKLSKEELDSVLEFHKEGTLAITIHHRTMTKDKKELLLKIVDEVASER